jgi:hypothetical protein
MTRPMAKVSINTPMGQYIAVIGQKISKKVMVLKLGPMALNMKGITNRAKKMVTNYIFKKYFK